MITARLTIAHRRRRLDAHVLFLVLASFAISSAAVPAFAVPQNLQYQGRLTDATGVPLTDPVDVRFSIYDVAEGGLALWSQAFVSLPLDNGRFNVVLGGVGSPFTPELNGQLRGGADLYLGIQVGADAEMTPRQQIASVVYALHANLADSAQFASQSRHATVADTARITLTTQVSHVASADTAKFASESRHAAKADTARYALAAQVVHVAAADTASFARESRHATKSDSAGFVAQVGHAAKADSATFAFESRHVAKSDTTTFAFESRHAAKADSVTAVPGIAYASIHQATVPLGTSASVMTLSITTPVDGYVLVVASGTLVLGNQAGTGVLCHANIGDQPLALPETTMGLAIASVDSTESRSNHYISFHCQRVYSKPAGAHSFYLNASIRSPSGSASVNRPTMTATFIPKIYGTTIIE